MEHQDSGQNESQTQPERKKSHQAEAESPETAACHSDTSDLPPTAPAETPEEVAGSEAETYSDTADLPPTAPPNDSEASVADGNLGEMGELGEVEAAGLVEATLPDGLPIRQVVEAVLFATDSPLPAAKIAQILETGTGRQVRKFIQQLNEEYAAQGRAFRIEEVAGGYQMLTLSAMQPWLVKLLRARQESRLSATQMETLAVVAYKQPVLRANVEVIRGVACGDMINRLREMGLVKIVGRAEDVGRPLLYGTTKKFLRVFGLGSLDDLPRVEELRPPGAAEAARPAAAKPVTAKGDEAGVTPEASAASGAPAAGEAEGRTGPGESGESGEATAERLTG